MFMHLFLFMENALGFHIYLYKVPSHLFLIQFSVISERQISLPLQISPRKLNDYDKGLKAN